MSLVTSGHLVEEEDDECEEGDGVECAVAEEGPPGEEEHRLGEEGAHADHEEDVEDGRAHDRPDAHVCRMVIIPVAVGNGNWLWHRRLGRRKRISTTWARFRESRSRMSPSLNSLFGCFVLSDSRFELPLNAERKS